MPAVIFKPDFRAPNPPVKPTVLIVTTTNWVPTARLAMALAHAGFRVEALCPARHPMSRTHAVAGTHRYRGLAPLRSLADAIAAAQPDLVLPGDDLAAGHLRTLYRERRRYAENGTGPGSTGIGLESLVERSLGSPGFFPVMQSRTAFMDLAREEGIRVPETGAVNNRGDVERWIEQADLPAVLKADGSSGGEGVRMAATAAEALRAFRKLQAPPLLARALKRALLDQDNNLLAPSLLRRRPTVSIQAFVAGHEATSAVACWQGTVLAGLHFEVLRKSNAAGHATVVRLTENAEMAITAEKIVRRMGLTGLCGFDFMLEASTGNAYLLEINPRATQVGHLALGEGRDLCAALYGAVVGQPVRVAPAVTGNSTIALFPHEWARDPRSEFLRTGYHDVPWSEPELVQACIDRSRKQTAWYARGDRGCETAMTAPATDIPGENAARGIAAR